MKTDNTVRNDRIRQLKADGKSQSQIAVALGITEGVVAGVLSKKRDKDNERKREARKQSRAGSGKRTSEARAEEQSELPRNPTAQPAAEAAQESMLKETPAARSPSHALRLDTAPVKALRLGARHRKELGDLDALVESIRVLDLLHPLVVTPDMQVIAGERRLRAVEKLGWQEVPVRVVEGLADARLALLAERDENTCRKDFTPSEAVAIGKTLEELEKPKAQKRKEATQAKGKDSEGKPIIGGSNLPPPKGGKGKTRDRVAEAVGMSGRSYEKAKAVVKAAEEAHEHFADVVEEMDATGKVDPAFKEMRRRQAGREAAESVDDEGQVTENADAINAFDRHHESEAVERWLKDRRQTWPETERCYFGDLVRRCLHNLESQPG